MTKILDGFEDAIIGVNVCNPEILIYDYDKMIKILMKRDHMKYDDAVEFLSYNVVDANFFDDSAIFISRCKNKWLL